MAHPVPAAGLHGVLEETITPRTGVFPELLFIVIYKDVHCNRYQIEMNTRGINTVDINPWEFPLGRDTPIHVQDVSRSHTDLETRLDVELFSIMI